MKNSNFRNLCNKYSVCKNAKYMAIVPFVIVLAAIIVIVAIGANTGSYTDAVGIGIDFEGGTILTVTQRYPRRQCVQDQRQRTQRRHSRR